MEQLLQTYKVEHFLGHFIWKSPGNSSYDSTLFSQFHME